MLILDDFRFSCTIIFGSFPSWKSFILIFFSHCFRVGFSKSSRISNFTHLFKTNKKCYIFRMSWKIQWWLLRDKYRVDNSFSGSALEWGIREFWCLLYLIQHEYYLDSWCNDCFWLCRNPSQALAMLFWKAFLVESQNSWRKDLPLDLSVNSKAELILWNLSRSLFWLDWTVSIVLWCFERWIFNWVDCKETEAFYTQVWVQNSQEFTDCGKSPLYSGHNNPALHILVLIFCKQNPFSRAEDNFQVNVNLHLYEVLLRSAQHQCNFQSFLNHFKRR